MIASSAPARATQAPWVLRRVRRLAWFALTASTVIVGTTAACSLGPLTQLDNDLALLVILISSWAIMNQVANYARGEEERLADREQLAREETVRAVVRVAKDRINNKLSLIAGYSEFLANDPRIPTDLRNSAQKAVEGAFAAAKAIDELSDTV